MHISLVLPLFEFSLGHHYRPSTVLIQWTHSLKCCHLIRANTAMCPQRSDLGLSQTFAGFLSTEPHGLIASRMPALGFTRFHNISIEDDRRYSP